MPAKHRVAAFSILAASLIFLTLTFLSGRTSRVQDEVLTQNSYVSNWSPAWSLDGSWIAFVSDRDGNPDIYIMAADGSNPRNLTQNSDHDSGPVWYDYERPHQSLG